MSVLRLHRAVRKHAGATPLRRHASLLSATALAVVGVAGPQTASAAPTTASTSLSALAPLSAANGYGPFERDRSNGGALAGDGRALTLNGQAFAHGLGVHAGSDLRYTVPSGCTWFWSAVGVDDEVGNRGSVVFQVYSGASKVYDSGVRTGSSPNAAASVRVTAGTVLRLVVTNAGDGTSYDHADWAGANFTCTTPTTTTTTTPTTTTPTTTTPTTTTPTTTTPTSPTPTTTSSPTPTTPPAPASTPPLLLETFTGADGTFVSQSDFWGSSDLGLSKNPTWFSESGLLTRSGALGKTSSDYFRMWTRKGDLAHVRADVDVAFNGFTKGTAGWHGINLWLHKQMCTPVPSCSAVNDPDNAGGNSGYVLDFMNRDGSLTILKKVSGDTRAKWPTSNMGVAEGGTYYHLAQSSFRPTVGRTYHLTGQSVDNGGGSTTLRILIDGQVRLEVRDDGRVGGPRLGGGRVGLRSDFTNMSVDNLSITG